MSGTVYGLAPAQRRLYEAARSAGDLVDQLRRLKTAGYGADPADVEQVRARLFHDAGVQERVCRDAR